VGLKILIILAIISFFFAGAQQHQALYGGQGPVATMADPILNQQQHNLIQPALLQNPAHSDHLTKLRPDISYIAVEECQTAAYVNSVKAKEDKGLVGLCLSIRHITMASTGAEGGGARLMTSGLLPRQVGGMGANSRTRIGNPTFNRNYDRLLMFADLSSTNGRCFACILERQKDSADFFMTMKTAEEGVGDIMVLEEPPPVKNTLGSTTSVAIVDICSRTVPALAHYPDVVPVTPLASPPAGDTAYFASHDVTNLELGGACFEEAICGGKLCDRQVEKKTPTMKCGCLYQTKGRALVVEMSVGIDVPMSFDASGKKVVHNFRSYRTSCLFVDSDCWSAILLGNHHHNRLLRKAVQKVLHHVNSNGGWTYIGWVRTGIVQDTSDIGTRDSENVASRDQTPHISYLYPTNPAAIADTNASYQSCKLTLQRLTAQPLPPQQQPAAALPPQQQQPAP
jgi:hypothetical protein